MRKRRDLASCTNTEMLTESEENKMTENEAIKILKSKMDGHTDTSYEWAETVRMAIKALERASCIKEKCAYCPHCEHCDVDDETLAIKALEPSEDAISRQALIEKATSWGKHFADSERCVSLTDIQNAPSVTPQPKMGQWIEVFVETPNDPYSYGFKSHKCSKCEYRPLQILNYCPNCGAMMTESEKKDE